MAKIINVEHEIEKNIKKKYGMRYLSRMDMNGITFRLKFTSLYQSMPRQL